MNTQFRKGVIEMCVLALIERKDMYGYEIVQSIAYYTEINEGTVYPILRRLTQEEYFVTYLKESTVGPARKYYHMTEKGKGYLGSLKADWDDFSKMVNDYISLINAPTEDKPFFKSYSVSYLGNVKEGRPVKYVNLPIEELKKAAIAQMQDGEPVWFGCDVGKRGSRTGGILDLDIYDLDGLFGTHFGMNKAERLEYGQSQMTHAMVFQGVNLDENGNPNRWRVENSWGEDACKDGYYVMSDRWFEEYTYQIVVNKKYLPKEVVEIFESEPIMLEPWDPMGSLAR